LGFELRPQGGAVAEVNLFVDTSVWSLALRRDKTPDSPAVAALVEALESETPVFTTGLVLQELLQGFAGPKAREAILTRFAAIPMVTPDREDHVEAAELRTRCRRRGLQVGTIDVLLAQLCVRNGLEMLSADRDFERIASVSDLRLWR
jgi:predicted nucleic acid-binding protein